MFRRRILLATTALWALPVSTALADDYAADTTTVGQIAVGDVLTGELETTGDQDWFALDLPAAASVEIRLRGSPTGDGSLSDPVLLLLDSDGNEVAFNDDSDGTFNSALIFEADTAGTYFVSAQAFAGATGTYTLSVTEYVAPEDDYPASTATTGVVFVGQPVTGEIEVADDEDWFALDADATMSYRINLEGTPTGMGSLPDPYLYLYDAQGLEIDWNDDGGQGFNSQITFTPPSPGRYYIGAAAFGSNIGTYTLSVDEFVAPPDDYANTVDTVGTIAVGSFATGEIEVENDADWFAVDLIEGVSYVITQEGAPTGMGTLSDPYVAIYDDAGFELDWNDDGGTDLNSRLIYTATYSGLHFIEAAAYGINTGTYEVAIQEFVAPDGDVGEDPMTSGFMEVNEPLFSALDYNGDIDLWEVDLVEGVTYTISMQGVSSDAGTLADPYLYLYDDTMNVIDANDDGGIDFDSELVYTAFYSGPHFIGAEAFADGMGTYMLTVATDDGVAGDVIAVEVDLVNGQTLRIEVPRDEMDEIETIRIRTQ